MLDRAALAEIVADKLPSGAALSLAAQRGEEVDALAWGTNRAGKPADTATLFQAASMSKPVAAATTLALVDRGVVGLDDEVNGRLESWQIPDPSGWTATVTIRHLLTHSAGLDVHGFPGYPQGEELPTTIQVLDGSGPANTPPVRVIGVPGLFPKYSGGGFTVVQQLLEDVTGQTYSQLATELVLQPTGMHAATAEFPIGAGDAERAARGTENGRALSGGWHLYPELCAAGLWATPSDLVRFLSAIRTSAADPGGFLSAHTATEMLTEHVKGWGLGISLDSDPRRYSHGGRNAGFVGAMLASREDPFALAVMLSEPAAGPLIRPLLLEAARAIGWHSFHMPEPQEATAELQAKILGIVGEYCTDEGGRISVIRDGGIALEVDGQIPLPLSFVAVDRWVSEALHVDVELERKGDQPTTLVVRQLGQVVRASRET
jgi:CubicO group peptidase (beta-lactamase class C family)